MLLVLIPVVGWGARSAIRVLGQRGEDIAMLSAAVLMPDGSGPLLRERFRAEIYNPEEREHGGEVQGEPIAQPEPSEQTSPAEQPASPDTDTGGTAPSGSRGPRIAEEYAAPIISEDFSGTEGGTVFRYLDGLIKNETKHTQEELEEILETPWATQLAQSDEPQVLIVHTHATEAFEGYDSEQYDIRNTWRSTDSRSNMVAVGDAVAQVLEERGIMVLHDTTQHDYPSYNGSYERSAETISAYLVEYPSIKIVLDLHRDAMQRDDAIVKAVATIDGRKAAQIMIIAACDDDSDSVPEWEENFRFAAQLQNNLEARASGLTRPVYLCYRKYNMDMTTGSLLLEFGSNANTLEEALYSAELAGEALADLIEDNHMAQKDSQHESTPDE